ncbi:MAG: hypothetical protein M3452_02950 [Chloroflexota bacterium]|nr:hypothetical protein [Chloroflexota bacterium]
MSHATVVDLARQAALRTSVLVAALIALLILSTAGNFTATVRAAEDGPATPLKAVIVVGPTHSSAAEYLAEGELFADQAEAAGMAVTRVFHPYATWSAVRTAAEGANLLVYFGHGNGWPSPYAPFQENTKNGFGLNTTAGGSTSSVTYYGGNKMRESLRLAPNAVVFLYRSCYAAGNGEAGQPVPTEAIALERTDNFAASFLAPEVGAGAVFAFWKKQFVDFAANLMTPGMTMEDILRVRTTMSGYPSSGWIGTSPVYAESTRTPGAQMLLDPRGATPEVRDYSRALSGGLSMTTDTWRGDAPEVGHEDDFMAPEVSSLAGVQSVDTQPAGEDAPPTFTPNGDGISDTMTLRHTVSEPAYLQFDIRDADGSSVRRITSWTDGEQGTSFWDGKDDDGVFVPEGRYLVAVTPRDRATNVGLEVSIPVKVFKSMKSPKAKPALFFARDGDSLVASSNLTVTLEQAAALTWQVVDATGLPVRTLATEQLLDVGAQAVRWDGRDELGNYVPDGIYTAIVTATTEAGSYSHRLTVRVMPFNVTAPVWSGPAGSKVTFTIKSAEPLTGWPRIEIRQPGLPMYTGYPIKYSTKLFKVTVTFKSGGTPGPVSMTVMGTDTGGGKQQSTHLFVLE